MAKKVDPAITLTRVFYDRKITSEEEDPEVARLTGSKPKTVKRFYRSRRRLYLADIVSIEEYKLDDFDEFDTGPLTYVEYRTDYFIAEIDFDILKDILDEYDKNKSLIINN